MASETKSKEAKASRDTQTFYRVNFNNNIGLLQIADNKANLLISINTLLISAIIAISGYGAISDKIETMGIRVLLPLVMIMLACLISTILAVKAAKPTLIRNKTDEDTNQVSSILFFGESSNYTLPEYLEKIAAIIPDHKAMYNHMSIALYQQGKVLNKKYNLLAYAYSIFMFGIASGALAYIGFLFW
jgi:hypothetical protein